MKQTLHFSYLLLALCVLFLCGAHTTFAQTYYECIINSSCTNQMGGHRCQIYNHDYTSSMGVPSFCIKDCRERSGITPECADVSVGESINPEAHERGWVWFLGFMQDIDPPQQETPDSEEKEKKKSNQTSENEKENSTQQEEESAITPFDPNEENPFETDTFGDLEFNSYKTLMWPDENGTKIAKIVGPYGKEKYTSDGKHFYEKPYNAAHSGEGVSWMANKISDAWTGFKDIASLRFLRGKLKDTDKELQREITREVLSESKSQKEKDIEKAYDKLSGIIDAPVLGDVPAKTVITAMQEATETEFAQGVMVYIQEREGDDIAGPRKPKDIYDNPPESMIYGGLKGVSQAMNASKPKAVLFSRYEEAYQRYKLAKELGRKK